MATKNPKEYDRTEAAYDKLRATWTCVKCGEPADTQQAAVDCCSESDRSDSDESDSTPEIPPELQPGVGDWVSNEVLMDIDQPRSVSIEIVGHIVEYYHGLIDDVIEEHTGRCGHDTCSDGGCDRAETAREYYHERGWTDETIDRYKLGWAPATDEVYEHLTDLGYTFRQIMSTGLITTWNPDPDDYHLPERRRDQSKIMGSNFVGRWVLPYFGVENGERVPIYVIARCTYGVTGGRNGGEGHPEDHTGGKYAKMAHSKPWVNTSEPIWGLSSIEPGKDIVIAEGVADAISASQAGYPTISPVAKEFKTDHVERLSAVASDRDIRTMYLIPDREIDFCDRQDDAPGEPEHIYEAINIPTDSSGPSGGMRTANKLHERGFDVRLVRLPLCSSTPTLRKIDLDDYLTGWSESLDAVLRSSRPVTDPKLEPLYERVVGDRGTRSASETDSVVGSFGTGDSGSGSAGSANTSAVFDLELSDVMGKKPGYRGKNPRNHTGDSEDYFVVDEGNGYEYAHDHKGGGLDNAFGALIWLLIEAGERTEEDPKGPLSDREIYVAWREAKVNGYTPPDDKVPWRGLIAAAIDLGVVESEADLITIRNPDPDDEYVRLGYQDERDTIDLIEERFGVTAGRERPDYMTKSEMISRALNEDLVPEPMIRPAGDEDGDGDQWYTVSDRVHDKILDIFDDEGIEHGRVRKVDSGGDQDEQDE